MKLSGSQEKILAILSVRRMTGEGLRREMSMSKPGLAYLISRLIAKGLVRSEGKNYLLTDDWREKLYRSDSKTDICGIAFALAGGTK